MTFSLKTLAPERNFCLAIIGCGALEFIVPEYDYRLGNGNEEARLLNLRRLGSSSLQGFSGV